MHDANDWDYPDGTDSTVRVRSGAYVDLLGPKVDTINIHDIAHALSHICRFGGHTATFYSVAEHSIHVSNALWRSTGNVDLALAGLLHDAAEAYIGDMVRPLKRHDDHYLEIETRFDTVIAKRFDVDLKAPEVKRIDTEILAWEMSMFRDCEWRTANDPTAVKCAFVARFFWLKRRREDTKRINPV